MPTPRKELYAVLQQVRTCFNRMKALAERLHADSGVSPPMRAVLEALGGGERLTVPEIARAKSVSRQHIQTVVDALLADGLVAAAANPAHRRSPHIRLTSKGRASFASIRAREAAPLERLADIVSADALKGAREVLLQINAGLAAEVTRGDEDA